MDIERMEILKDIETSGGYSAKVSGDTGEFNISKVMRSLPNGHHIINNVLLKTKGGTTQLDHVIVNPYGVFVIETKNHKGIIYGDSFGRVWTQVLTNRQHFTFYSPVLQNQTHIKNLCERTKINLNYVQGLIVFTNENVDLSNVNCPVCFNVNTLYGYLMSFTQPIFSSEQIVEIIKRIDSVNISSYINDANHVEYVKQIKQQRGY